MNWIEVLAAAASAFTAAILVSRLANYLMMRKPMTPERAKRIQKRRKRISSVLVSSVFAVLSIGLIWTIYFLVIGLYDPAQSEYAANSATLIVSVLTVFSIIIAFYEFLGRDKK